jgi:hypothetical protein
VRLSEPDWSGFLPPPPRTVQAVLPHTAHRRLSPPAFGLTRQGLLALGETTVPREQGPGPARLSPLVGSGCLGCASGDARSLREAQARCCGSRARSIRGVTSISISQLGSRVWVTIAVVGMTCPASSATQGAAFRVHVGRVAKLARSSSLFREQSREELERGAGLRLLLAEQVHSALCEERPGFGCDLECFAGLALRR